MNESQGGSHDARRNSNLLWIICRLLFLAATVNYADRQVIGILKPTLQLQLHWSEVDYGHIIEAFQFAYALGYLLVGRLMDRTGSYRGFIFAIASCTYLAALGIIQVMVGKADAPASAPAAGS
jgi:ACS family hexuronate transporter-like MFS transporter